MGESFTIVLRIECLWSIQLGRAISSMPALFMDCCKGGGSIGNLIFRVRQRL
jgi:hypothetical protein